MIREYAALGENGRLVTAQWPPALGTPIEGGEAMSPREYATLDAEGILHPDQWPDIEPGGPVGSNFLVAVDAAPALRSVLSGVAARLAAGFAVVRHVGSLTPYERPALALSLLASGDVARPQVKAGSLLTMRATGTLARPAATPGMSVVQTRVALTHRSGGNAVVETAVAARTDWASDANATGLNNTTVATFVGNALGARGGQLELDYANFASKTALAISLVRLHFYVSVAGTLLNNADVRLGWLKSGSTFTILETITGDVASLTTPRTFDITGSITGWADLDALRTCVRAEAALGETWTASADAVELEVVAESVV